MEIEHRAHDSADIPENMDEQSVRKQLAQATDVERVFWRSIHPTSFGAVGVLAASSQRGSIFNCVWSRGFFPGPCDGAESTR